MSRTVPLYGFGSGGVSLNFKVTGGTTQPAAGENTVWIHTDRNITGYIFAAAEPADPA